VFAHFQGNQLEDAVADYSKAIEFDPNDGDSLVSRGLAYIVRGERDKALVDYEEAIRLHPDHVRAHGNRGNALVYKGDFNGAIVQGVYNGGGYDQWADDVLANHPGVASVNAYSLLNAAASLRHDLGTGTLVLTNANSYNGGTIISGGVLKARM